MDGLADRTVRINALADKRIARWDSVNKCTGRWADWHIGNVDKCTDRWTDWKM
jgi:hypothetical protein